MHRPALLSWPAGRLALAAPLAAGLALAAAVIPAGMASAAPAALPSNCTPSGSTVTCTFAFTGAAQSWTAPAGVSAATVTLDGGQGGNAPSSYFPQQAGGKAATVVATIPVTAGVTYQVLAGGAAPGNGNEAGGFNGGGSGSGVSGIPNAEGGGGGASDVRSPAADGSYPLANRLLVAGGGGGAAGYGLGNGSGGTNGPPGGLGGPSAGAGQPGVTETLDPAGQQGGGGGGGGAGTATAGGAGGTAGAGGVNPAQNGSRGSAGSAGTGGAPASDSLLHGSGGGGGGGYYGGGSGGQGGTGGWTGNNYSAGGGGGGGGSDFVTPAATAVTITDGAWSGNGQVVITYAPPPCPASSTLTATVTSSPAATLEYWPGGQQTLTLPGHPGCTVTVANPSHTPISNIGGTAGTAGWVIVSKTGFYSASGAVSLPACRSFAAGASVTGGSYPTCSNASTVFESGHSTATFTVTAS